MRTTDFTWSAGVPISRAATPKQKATAATTPRSTIEAAMKIEGIAGARNTARIGTVIANEIKVARRKIRRVETRRRKFA